MERATIKQATSHDIPIILDLYKRGLDELGENYKESLLLKKVINSFHLAPCFLLEVNGSIEGMAAFTVITLSHNGTASLSDYMFYVSPEHRNLANLDDLVLEAKKFAETNDLAVRVDFIVNNDLETRIRLLKMNGFAINSVAGVYNGRK